MAKNKSQKSATTETVRPRNPVARSPLLRKGGVHEKTKTVKRRDTKQKIEAELESWRGDVDFERSLKKKEDKKKTQSD